MDTSWDVYKQDSESFDSVCVERQWHSGSITQVLNITPHVNVEDWKAIDS